MNHKVGPTKRLHANAAIALLFHVGLIGAASVSRGVRPKHVAPRTDRDDKSPQGC